MKNRLLATKLIDVTFATSQDGLDQVHVMMPTGIVLQGFRTEVDQHSEHEQPYEVFIFVGRELKQVRGQLLAEGSSIGPLVLTLTAGGKSYRLTTQFQSERRFTVVTAEEVLV